MMLRLAAVPQASASLTFIQVSVWAMYVEGLQ
jgi:hypothetical protein